MLIVPRGTLRATPRAKWSKEVTFLRIQYGARAPHPALLVLFHVEHSRCSKVSALSEMPLSSSFMLLRTLSRGTSNGSQG